MMKVFFDTNLVLDAIIQARSNFLDANVIMSASDNGEITGCVSFLTVANTAYILRKGRDEKELVSTLRSVMEGIEILPMDNAQVQLAYKVDAPDFEDVLQYECAKAAGCSLIVTNNTRHFNFCNDIKVISTTDYASELVEKGQ